MNGIASRSSVWGMDGVTGVEFKEIINHRLGCIRNNQGELLEDRSNSTVVIPRGIYTE
jgi:hypothetical protein